MAPKYRGKSEEWLNDEKTQKSRSARSAANSKRKPDLGDKAAPLVPAEANATVSEVFPNLCKVRLDVNRAELLCSYRRATIFRYDEEVRERSPVAVGDRVKVHVGSPQNGVVEGLCERRNHLSRPAPGKERGADTAKRIQHVIAANIDLLVVVASAGEPLFSPGLVDRYLVAASAAGIEPILCLNKVDLAPAGVVRPSDLYRDLGYPVFEASAKKDQGIVDLKARLRGREVVFCGQSGVGKTSLLTALLGVDAGRVGELSAATGKGRHTTTGAILLPSPADEEGTPSRWIDTPGIREFGLSQVAPAQLAGHFPEMRGLPCEVESCLHLDEPGCAARGQVRYDSYRRILESLLAGEG